VSPCLPHFEWRHQHILTQNSSYNISHFSELFKKEWLLQLIECKFWNNYYIFMYWSWNQGLNVCKEQQGCLCAWWNFCALMTLFSCMDWIYGNPRVGLCVVVREEFLHLLWFSWAILPPYTANPVITARHTCTISVGCVKPNFQGLTWFECWESRKEEPLRRFKFFLNNLKYPLDCFIINHWALTG
jgi:hypothetical protein